MPALVNDGKTKNKYHSSLFNQFLLLYNDNKKYSFPKSFRVIVILQMILFDGLTSTGGVDQTSTAPDH